MERGAELKLLYPQEKFLPLSDIVVFLNSKAAWVLLKSNRKTLSSAPCSTPFSLRISTSAGFKGSVDVQNIVRSSPIRACSDPTNWKNATAKLISGQLNVLNWHTIYTWINSVHSLKEYTQHFCCKCYQNLPPSGIKQLIIGRHILHERSTWRPWAVVTKRPAVRSLLYGPDGLILRIIAMEPSLSTRHS